MVNEGLAMLSEGVHPISIERATTQAGYPAPVLQLSDELNLEPMGKIAKATAEAAERDGTPYTPDHGQHVVEQMLDAGRPGRLRGAGFSHSHESGTPGSLWAVLPELSPLPEAQDPSPAPTQDRPS